MIMSRHRAETNYSRPIKVSFADLTHTGQLVATNTFPLGISMVAAYARKELGAEIEFEIFRYPEDFSNYLESSIPQIACFSMFAWNMRLSHEFARRLKIAAPKTIIVFGGVNFPDILDEQEGFLRKYPAIDFCIEGEGELAFIELYNALRAANFDGEDLKRSRRSIPNTCYLQGDKMVKGDLLARIVDLNIIPSTFESGMSDKFFDEQLIPMIQTTRGCPYSCTFCHEGARYFNKTRRVSQARVEYEIDYIAERVKTPDFIITDLNFGMFPEDVETSRLLARKQDERDWPKFVTIATAKNHKERVLDISKILRGAVPPGAAVQSTDPDVLTHIKRKNLPLDAIVEVARTAETDGACSFSEVILCLPGDSKRAHFKSITDVTDAGFTLVRTYQFLMLNGTEAATGDSRGRYEMQTRFRVKPMNIGIYRVRDETFPSVEIEEICVANNTMPYEDYQACRALSLTVEIFNNNGMFFDLMQFLAQQGIPRSRLIMAIHDRGTNGDGWISDVYRRFAEEEERNLWDSEEELADFVQRPGVIQRYLDGELGVNEIYKYRALSFLDHMDELHEISFDVGRSLLSSCNRLSRLTDEYLTELKRVSLLRKQNLFDIDRQEEEVVHFDFVKLVESNFAIAPLDVYVPDGIGVRIFHSSRQIDTINGYVKEFGGTLVGLGRILNRAHISSLFRSASYSATRSIVRVSGNGALAR